MVKKYILMLAIITSACSPSQTTEDMIEVQVAAASSLQPALRELEEKVENNIENVDVVIQYGGSGALRRQIEQGAPFDIFLSASEAHFHDLVAAERIIPEQSVDLLKNSLVFIQPTDTKIPIANIEELPQSGIRTLAIGTPDSVPAGMFAQEVMKNLGMWEELKDQTVQTRSVRQIVTYIEESNVDAGFVFATDAASSDQIKTVEAIDSDLHADIVYPIGIVRDTEQLEVASQVYDFLISEEAKIIYESYGYEVIET